MAKPFIKWAGGKSQLLEKIDEKISGFVGRGNDFIYVEPFVGGGSVFFHIAEHYPNMKYAVINDLNPYLMNCYKIISDNKKYIELKKILYGIQESYNSCSNKQEKYNLYRFQYNHWIKNELDMGDVWGAAAFMFLNKCCFNGLYRVNQKGEFNVPWGKKDYLKIYDEDNLDKCHVILNEKAICISYDYNATGIFVEMGRVNKCDVVYYLDPPYKPVSDTSSFTSYTKNGFSDDEQIKLMEFCRMIDKSGCKFLLSNSKCGDYFDKLYDGYNVDTVKANRNINSVGSKRSGAEEVLISNYNGIQKYHVLL